MSLIPHFLVQVNMAGHMACIQIGTHGEYFLKINTQMFTTYHNHCVCLLIRDAISAIYLYETKNKLFLLYRITYTG